MRMIRSVALAGGMLTILGFCGGSASAQLLPPPKTIPQGQPENPVGVGGPNAEETRMEAYMAARQKALSAPPAAAGVKYVWKGRSKALDAAIAVVWYASTPQRVQQDAESIFRQQLKALNGSMSTVFLAKGQYTTARGLEGDTYIYARDSQTGDWRISHDPELLRNLARLGY